MWTSVDYVHWIIVLALKFVLVGWINIGGRLAQAQELESAQCNSSITWMNNVNGESPCAIALDLMLQCSGDNTLTIPPLNSTEMTYANPTSGADCTCNTVVYNLISGCVYCQGGVPSSFESWTNSCTSILYGQYPDKAVASTFDTPNWAYANLSNAGGFDLAAAQDIAGVSNNNGSHWTTLQIVIPVISAVAVALVALGLFLLYRRRIKKMYSRISDLSDNRTHTPSNSGSAPTIASFFVGSQTRSRRSASSKRARAVAWAPANLQAPRKLGGLIPDRRHVHHHPRGDDWSIDMDADDAASLVSTHRRGNSSHDLTSEVLPPIQDSPALNTSRPTPGVARGGRLPPVHVVSTPPRKGFRLDGADSLTSPTTVASPDTLAMPQQPSVEEPGENGEAARQLGEGGREVGGVLLISHLSSQDFLSLGTSPVTTEAVQSSETSHGSNEQWPSALPDESSINHTSSSNALLASQANNMSSSYVPSNLAGPSIVASSVRPAGTTTTPVLPTASASAIINPNTGLAPARRASEAPSSGSSAEYTVPNPFTFNLQQGNPLRQSAPQTTVSSNNPFRGLRPANFDLDG